MLSKVPSVAQQLMFECKYCIVFKFVFIKVYLASHVCISKTHLKSRNILGDIFSSDLAPNFAPFCVQPT